MNIQLPDLIASLKSGFQYLPTTFILSFVPLSAGLFFGTLIALAQIFKVPVLKKVFSIFVSIYSGIPSVVALLIYNLLYITQFNKIMAFFGSSLTVRDVNPVYVALFTFSLSSIVLMSETIRGALLSVDKGQFEAGYSVGLTTRQILHLIVFPQVVPVILPPLTNHVVGSVKNTSIVMTIGVMDVLNGAIVPAETTYRFLEGYIASALIYWAVNALLEFLLRRLEKHTGKFRDRECTDSVTEYKND
ncbi:MAG TPA: amino acid ABC transporter permease [Treponema sp.]|nr:amino acid ABC transporter permease [Treponema sp.]